MTTAPLLTSSEAAALLGVSPTDLARLRQTKNGPRAIRIGRRIIRYEAADLEAWRAARMPNEPPAPALLFDGRAMPQAIDLSGEELIYGLADPRTPDVVAYVGRTTSPLARLLDHGAGGTVSTAAWAEELRASGLYPSMVCIERCAPARACEREAHWQHWYAARGQARLNRESPARRARRERKAS